MGATAGALFGILGSAIPEGAGAAVASSVAGAATGAVLSKALAPGMPKQKEPTAMPDQSAIDAAKKRSVLQQRQRSGRESTILTTGDGGTLG